MPDTATNVIEAARKLAENSCDDWHRTISEDDYDDLVAALKTYDVERSQPAPNPGWSMKFEDCGPNDPGAIQCMNGGAAPSWMRRVE